MSKNDTDRFSFVLIKLLLSFSVLFLNANHEGSGNNTDNSRSNGNIFKIQTEELKSGMSRIKREVM